VIPKYNRAIANLASGSEYQSKLPGIHLAFVTEWQQAMSNIVLAAKIGNTYAEVFHANQCTSAFKRIPISVR